MQNEVWNFIIRIISHLDDSEDDERKQIYKCLSLLENLLDFKPAEFANKLMHIDTLIDWFIKELEEGDVGSENYLLTSELLSAIVTNCHDEYKVKFTKTLNAMERLFSVLNKYRKAKKLETEEEYESVANMFDTISATLLI